MTIGVPLLDARVAPRCTSANRLLLVTLSSAGSVSNRVIDVQLGAAEELIELARRHGITMLDCGGITRESRELLQLNRIRVVENVACSADEVLRALERGMLRAGYGLDPATVQALTAAATPPRPEAPVGGAVVAAVGGAGGESVKEIASVAIPSPTPVEGGTSSVAALARATGALAVRRAPEMGRLAEVVSFCAEAGLTRLGLAFCAELRRPARVLARSLSAWIEVMPVGCTLCPLHITGGHGPLGGNLLRGPTGDPFRQVHALNAAATDLNVAFGLCVGAECILSRVGGAPLTALFVQDVPHAGDPFRSYASAGELRRRLASELPGVPERQTSGVRGDV